MRKETLFALIFILNMVTEAVSQRTLQYYPSAEGFVCVNGQNRYTRALYGSHDNWRLETSDRPIFCAFDKGCAWNVQFFVRVGDETIALDSTTCCRATYFAGKREYALRDERLGNVEMRLTAMAEHEGNNALWRLVFPKNTASELIAQRCPIVNPKMSRNGDLGIDSRDNFEALHDGERTQRLSISLDYDTVYVRLEDNDRLVCLSKAEGDRRFDVETVYYGQLSSRLVFQTPDTLINNLGHTLMAAADGLWDGETWQHGCIGWRTPLAGWRGAYVGDVAGWTDRSRSHFRAYAASMVRDIEPRLAHPAQDTAKHLARSIERWGTPMYSNGYICKLPNNDRKMSHYDMNLNYVDELLWHFQYDADTTVMREFWPTLVLHHQWEKRNWDPDGDHLYDGYCCIWASDALYYNSGAVTHASAYNYRGNLLTARIAELLGEDPTPYRNEAEAILRAMNQRLWVGSQVQEDIRGVSAEVPAHWAEFQDFMGLRRLHPNAALWSIYTPIDCGVCTSRQAYEVTRWVDACIPHIPLQIDGAEDSLFTLSTTDWMPYVWSTNNVAHEEVANMALADFIAGRRETGYRLLYSDLLDEMCAGASPGNFGQISYYDRVRNEAYRDFGDNIGITARAIVQGLFGIRPDALFGRCYLQPGFPQAWDSVRVTTPTLSYHFFRENGMDVYEVEQHFSRPLQLVLRLPLGNGEFFEVTGNKDVSQRFVVESSKIPTHDSPAPAPFRPRLDEHRLGLDDIALTDRDRQQFIDLSSYYNASVDDIFRQQYLSPRSPYTTLSLPSHGMGDWCQPLLLSTIEDDGLRGRLSEEGIFATGLGLNFALPREGCNILYTSLWDNFPDSLTIAVPQDPLSGQGDREQSLCLLMAGSTNNMQSRIDNALLIARYADGTADTLHLINPYNWCPIEQEYHHDDLAFWSVGQHPYRVHLGSGMVSRNLKEALNLPTQELPNGAAQILSMPLAKGKKLSGIMLRTLSNDVVIGLMAATLVTHTGQ